ncbi:hypothetical protein WMF27_20515 [Sorangium sp. So ce281]|uniref:hypothetical protein n=1 Tax=unclassified Sorangium TaxID=2621164 RepID=UPI003F648FE3
MASFAQYTNATVTLKGASLEDVTAVTVKRHGSKTRITVVSAVPAAGFEVLWGESKEPVQVSVSAAGKTIEVLGSVVEDCFSYSVASGAQYSFTLEADATSWQ